MVCKQLRPLVSRGDVPSAEDPQDLTSRISTEILTLSFCPFLLLNLQFLTPFLDSVSPVELPDPLKVRFSSCSPCHSLLFPRTPCHSVGFVGSAQCARYQQADPKKVHLAFGELMVVASL